MHLSTRWTTTFDNGNKFTLSGLRSDLTNEDKEYLYFALVELSAASIHTMQLIREDELQ